MSLSELTDHVYVDNANHYKRGVLYEESYQAKNIDGALGRILLHAKGVENMTI